MLMVTDEKMELILSQWQTCVEMANSVSQRRDSMNNYNVEFGNSYCGVSDMGFENTPYPCSRYCYLYYMAAFY